MDKTTKRKAPLSRSLGCRGLFYFKVLKHIPVDDILFPYSSRFKESKGMKLFQRDGIDLYTSLEMETDIRELADITYDEKIYRISREEHFEETLWGYELTVMEKYVSGVYRNYIELYAQRTRINNHIAVLNAHGFVDEGGEWGYEDTGVSYEVQSWINQNDGKYACLMLCVCNPFASMVVSRHSLVVLADTDIGFIPDYYLSLHHPILGEIDDYVIDSHWEKLARQ